MNESNTKLYSIVGSLTSTISGVVFISSEEEVSASALPLQATNNAQVEIDNNSIRCFIGAKLRQ
jgi:hypothetical protein